MRSSAPLGNTVELWRGNVRIGALRLRYRLVWQRKGVKMKSALKATLGALALAAVSTFSANAATVTVSGSAVTPAPNTFQTQLMAAGATTFLDKADIVVGKFGATLTFTGVAGESGFANSFESPVGNLSEPAKNNQGAADFLTGNLFGSVSGKFTAGSLAGVLRFLANGGSPAPLGSERFGIYASGTGPLSVFFLAFDDQSQGADDNHDDFIIRVNVSAVPVPAAGFLLVGALGGLALLRRRKA